ncbi:hypothetical protein DPMN_167609 [Dreissena polymorpha]|uniref:Uncharacterized protein n=1 Tax=Dreissena polymorpha TaxID=45954 RepID=A0A9D4EZ48_DREPO|nr:hypothetical protein DPMN_167609 [Dreissena polymorpha]
MKRVVKLGLPVPIRSSREASATDGEQLKQGEKKLKTKIKIAITFTSRSTTIKIILGNNELTPNKKDDVPRPFRENIRSSWPIGSIRTLF